jgi:hypothetical protein
LAEHPGNRLAGGGGGFDQSQSMAIDPENQAVIVPACETTNHLAYLGEDVADAGGDPLVAGATHWDCELTDPDP